MQTLIYNSQIEEYLGDIDISSLLYAARLSNAQHQITGILLHNDGHFLQLLEGEQESVRKLYDIISRDRRHKNLKVLLDQEINKRQFDGWDMGFKNVKPDELEQRPELKALFVNGGTTNTDAIYDYLVSLNEDPACREAFY